MSSPSPKPAAAKRTLDVFIVESKTVYSGVPFAVVADWIQQSRLLDEDQVRISGSEKWKLIRDVPALAAYVPKADEVRIDDQAEALERVEVGFGWKPRRGDDDDDVDMIPLIDVTLVLLIFFMMTATAGAGSLIRLPTARSASMSDAGRAVWLGIEPGADGGEPRYSIGVGSAGPAAEDAALSEPELLQKLDARIEAQAEPFDVNLKADAKTPTGVVRRLAAELERRRFGDKRPKGIHLIHSAIREEKQ